MEEREMNLPTVENRVNLNTLLQIVQIIMIVGGGAWFAATIRGDVDRNTRDISKIQTNVSSIATDASAYTNIRFRVDRLEQGFIGVTTDNKDLERQINGMAADVRVIREIVNRLDKSR